MVHMPLTRVNPKKKKPVQLLRETNRKTNSPKRGPGKRWLRYLFWVFPLLLIVASYLLIFRNLPSPQRLGNYDIPLATKIYDRNGILLYDIYADQNRTPVQLAHIPKVVQQATIAIEDKDFYSHQGVNPIGGILRAAVATLTGHKLQGGSTITQQLVKSALLTSERSVIRKLKEIVLAFWVEILYPKDKILELYLNQVPYGGTAWGIETAAEKYFGKNVKDLTLAEAALLAGLPQAPTLYSPYGAHPELAVERQAEVLRRMVEEKYITAEQARKAKAEQIQLAKPANIRAPHFVMYIKEQLVDTYGENLVERGGLKVITSLDINLQEYIQATMAAEIEKLQNLRVGNGAAVVTKPATGEILAMVGSRDYFASPSGSYNVTTAKRQPGSSIKPINYAIGIENRLVNPATMFLDVPSCFTSPNQPPYCPKNYDGAFHGPVQLRFALGNSFNIPAVKMLKLNTVQTMIASASGFGLTTLKDPSKYGLSLTLGGGEVRMIDMATAFGVFANGGIRKEVSGLLKVVDKNGKVLYENRDPNLDKDVPSRLLLSGPRTLSTETSFLISHILLDNNARSQAFGSRSALVIPNHTVSVKTGTTDDKRDNWTIGYTPQYLVAVWVGNNDNSPMHPYLVSGITGAAPIWNKIMAHVLDGKPDIWPQQPEGISGAEICNLTGRRPPNPEGPDKGCDTRFEYFIKGTIPGTSSFAKQIVPIDKNTQNIAAPGQTENIEMQEKQILTDGISTWCVDCQHTTPTPPPAP
jgi:1A family penicillin-binding protein